ncbi:hypothetical protein BC940DRAFT_6593 [Gongronella butleri]|nr:hypothetical protein BC940DRAFT_6593 [Gongronella butleri]
MFDSPNLDDAIAQLEILGIDRQKAIKALSRYNYDVERAADYIFSGNAISDDDDKDDVRPCLKRTRVCFWGVWAVTHARARVAQFLVLERCQDNRLALVTASRI